MDYGIYVGPAIQIVNKSFPEENNELSESFRFSDSFCFPCLDEDPDYIFHIYDYSDPFEFEIDFDIEESIEKFKKIPIVKKLIKFLEKNKIDFNIKYWTIKY